MRRFVKRVFWVGLLGLVAAAAFVRLTPVPVEGMHLRSPLSGLGHLED